jgi:hypothetical protein
MAGNDEVLSDKPENDQVLSKMARNDQELSTMPGNDQAVSTMISKCPKLLIRAPQNRPCPKLEGAGDNGSANIEKSLLTVAMQFATLFTVNYGRSNGFRRCNISIKKLAITKVCYSTNSLSHILLYVLLYSYCMLLYILLSVTASVTYMLL